MTLIRDVIPSMIESVFSKEPFDEAVSELQCGGYDIISLKQFADSRIAQGRGSDVANSSAYVSESFVYDKDTGIYLARKSLIIENAREATNCHRNGKEFYLTPSQVEESLGKIGIDSIRFKNSKPIPTERFGEDERTVFAFGDSAKAYGEFLKDSRILKMPIYLEGTQSKPFARQAWLHRLVDKGSSELVGNYKYLEHSYAVRGIRDIQSENFSSLFNCVCRYSRRFVPEAAMEEFRDGLAPLFDRSIGGKK